MEQIKAEIHENKRKKQRLLEQMLCIANTQMTKIEEDSVEKFMQALKQRHHLIQKIERLDESINTLSLQLTQQGFPAISEPDLIDIEIRDTVKMILSVDEACRGLASEKLRKYKSEFKSLKKSGLQLNMYAQPYSVTNGIFIDMKK